MPVPDRASATKFPADVKTVGRRARNHARPVLATARRNSGLRADLNAPCRTVDDVPHIRRVQGTPYGLPGALRAVSNDLITCLDAKQRMADLLAPVLNMGLVEIQKQAKAS